MKISEIIMNKYKLRMPPTVYYDLLADVVEAEEEQEPILDRDCEHCSKTYGTLGCCTTVSNKWVYSCKEGQREYLLDKLRAEIETKYGQCKLTEYIVQYDGICTSANDIGDIADILQIIDKYKAESEDKE